MELHCLQTVDALMSVGTGRRDSMCSITSALRELNSAIFEGARGGGDGGYWFPFVRGNGSRWREWRAQPKTGDVCGCI